MSTWRIGSANVVIARPYTDNLDGVSSDSDRLHLVRHGEVENPGGIVYAGLPGFDLADRGRRQASSAAARLAARPVDTILSSPLKRAVETAHIIAALLGADVTVDERLTEWGLLDRWAGHRWDDLDDRFPGELAAYLADPTDLPFAPETLRELATRAVEGITTAWRSRSGGDVVVVGHQDPTQAAWRQLTGRSLDDFHADKPAHAAVVTLAPGLRRWRTVAVFTPSQR
jgi:broad specificity phosphatase PhoE